MDNDYNINFLINEIILDTSHINLCSNYSFSSYFLNKTKKLDAKLYIFSIFQEGKIFKMKIKSLIMDSYDNLPNTEIIPIGEISKIFLNLGVRSFKEACEYVHNMEYGYNTTYKDRLILFTEKMGTCTTKHAIIAGLAEELDIPLYKHVGIYKFTEEISTDANDILKKYNIPYVPMAHCFLVYKEFSFDLTEGNCNGKNTTIENFIHEEKVDPFISRKDEYLLYKQVLKEKILPSREMEGIKERSLLKAREESIILLKKNVIKQKQLLTA